MDTMAITALPLDCWLKERLKNWVQLSGHEGNQLYFKVIFHYIKNVQNSNIRLIKFKNCSFPETECTENDFFQKKFYSLKNIFYLGTIVPASNHTLWKKQPCQNTIEAVAYAAIMKDSALRGLTPKFFKEILHKNECNGLTRNALHFLIYNIFSVHRDSGSPITVSKHLRTGRNGY